MAIPIVSLAAPAHFVTGADWLQAFEIAPENPQFRLDGWDVTAHLRRTVEGEIELEMSTEAGTLVVADPRGRRVSVNMGATATAGLAPGAYVMDFRLVNAVTGLTLQTEPFAVAVSLPVTRPL